MTRNLEELKAMIGLRMCDGIGDITAFKLLSHCGSAEAVFKEKKKHLSSIPGLSPNIYDVLRAGTNWKNVDTELEFIVRNNISFITILDKNYPKSLLDIDSPPILLFFSGHLEGLNKRASISIVGTRNPTGYGLDAVTEIIKALKGFDLNIISGLALGIDIAAHKGCLENDIPTFGIVGHGINTVYPSIHKPYATKMASSGGGIITEFFSNEKPNRENFPKRNRIIAGISFATIVIEASKKSGTLITAEYALSYKRKVFALPGRFNDRLSEGCNLLLNQKKTKPILSISSLLNELGLRENTNVSKPNTTTHLSNEEVCLLKIITEQSKISLDALSVKSEFNISNCSAIMLGLEMKGLIRCLPGKLYERF